MNDLSSGDLLALTLFIKFMLVSTALLGGVYLCERVGLIKTPKLSQTAWIAAIIASFVAMLPSPFPAVDIQVAAPFVTEPIVRDAAARPILEPSLSSPDGLTLTAPPAAPAAGERAPNTRDQAAPAISDRAESLHTQEPLVSQPATASQLMLGSWAILGGIALLALGLSYRRAVSDLGDRVRVPAEHPANQRLRALCERVDIRHVPYLSRSSSINSPVCLPRREICLPDWAFDDMPAEALNSLIAHELAHMLRRDPINMIFMQFLCRIFFFQPMFALARRRLEDAAELAADEWAATTTANAGAVANALYTCAKKITEKRQIQWGLAMAGDQSILKQRVARLLKAKQSAFDTTGKAAPAAVAATILLAACAAPGVEFAAADYDDRDYEYEYSTEHKNVVEHKIVTEFQNVTPTLNSEDEGRNLHIVSGDNGFETGNMHWFDDDRSVRASWEGKFILSDDERSVIDITHDGMLKLEGTKDGIKRRVRFEKEEGALETDYWVNGKRADFDATGEEWLADTLQHMLRHTAIDMDGRVARYLKTGGADYALKRGVELVGDYTKRMFVMSLLNQTSLNENQHDTLKTMLATIDSDYEIRLLVTHFVDAGILGDDDIVEVLDIAKRIDSDYEMRLTLSPMIERWSFSEEALRKVLTLAQTIDSDYELRLLLSIAADAGEFSRSNKLLFIDAMDTIDSDYEKRLLIGIFAAKARGDEAITTALFEQISKMSGDYEKRLGLGSVLTTGTMSSEAWALAIRTANTIDGDYEKAQALTHMASLARNDTQVLRSIRESAEGISGDYERDNVLNVIDSMM